MCVFLGLSFCFVCLFKRLENFLWRFINKDESFTVNQINKIGLLLIFNPFLLCFLFLWGFLVLTELGRCVKGTTDEKERREILRTFQLKALSRVQSQIFEEKCWKNFWKSWKNLKIVELFLKFNFILKIQI